VGYRLSFAAFRVLLRCYKYVHSSVACPFSLSLRAAIFTRARVLHSLYQGSDRSDIPTRTTNLTRLLWAQSWLKTKPKDKKRNWIELTRLCQVLHFFRSVGSLGRFATSMTPMKLPSLAINRRGQRGRLGASLWIHVNWPAVSSKSTVRYSANQLAKQSVIILNPREINNITLK